MLNLAVNARDAMPEGGRLSIRLDAVAPGAVAGLPGGAACYLRLRVADTGTGMDAATLARAVEPFFSTKPVGQGTGLGLSMAHGVARQLGGDLRLSSVPGQGTTAELLLPAATGIAGGRRRRAPRLLPGRPDRRGAAVAHPGGRRRPADHPQHRRHAGGSGAQRAGGGLRREGPGDPGRRRAGGPAGDRLRHARHDRARGRRGGAAAPPRAAGGAGERLRRPGVRRGALRPAAPDQALPAGGAGDGDRPDAGGRRAEQPVAELARGRPADRSGRR